MLTDAVSRTANVERNGGHKWVNWASMMPREASLSDGEIVRMIAVKIPDTEKYTLSVFLQNGTE